MYDDDEYEYDEYPGYPEYPQRQVPRRYYAETVGTVLQALTEYARTLEKEKSGRAEIERRRETALQVIRSQRRMMIEYLNHRFGERGKLYERYFQLVDAALEVRNDEIIRIALDSVLNVYQNNPGDGIEELQHHIENISEAVRI